MPVSPNPESVVTCGAPQLTFGPGAAGASTAPGILRRSMHLW
jgi:hypothetical protein